MDVRIETTHLIIEPFDFKYLKDYYQEFTEEITKYQYPDPFLNQEEASQLVSEFVSEMEQGNMLELVILSKEEEFLGSMEVFGLKEENSEVGLWLKKDAHGCGYGYEALQGLLSYLKETTKRQTYIYEVDVRNEASIHLVEKFPHKKGKCEELVTESGKKLNLQMYFIEP